MPHDIVTAMNHPLYQKASKDWEKEVEEQITKGAYKYDRPLDHNEYIPEELVRHARQELVDGNHYLTCMDLKMQEMQEDIHTLLEIIRFAGITTPLEFLWPHKYSR